MGNLKNLGSYEKLLSIRVSILSMYLKELLKPTRKSIGFFILLILLGNTPHIGYYYVPIMCIIGPCPPSLEVGRAIFYPYNLFHFFSPGMPPLFKFFKILSLYTGPTNYVFIGAGVVFPLSTLIYWYLLSCLLVFAYGKFKKNF